VACQSMPRRLAGPRARQLLAPPRPNACAPTGDRRRKGLHCFTLEIRRREIDVLVKRGLLEPVARNDPYQVKMALYRHLDKTLSS
jgi:hypothetical protein